jgi:hypothetical protein
MGPVYITVPSTATAGVGSSPAAPRIGDGRPRIVAATITATVATICLPNVIAASLRPG